MNPFSLEGKSILVTGSSSGIGRAIAVLCSQMGAQVILHGRNQTRLNEVMSELEGEGHQIVTGDLTSEQDISDISETISFVDGVVHCAGIGHRCLCKQLNAAEINKVMNANFRGTVLLQTALLESKKINKGGSIVFIASRAAESPAIGNAVYSASKGALISYAKCLGLELAPLRRVNCICPSMVWTNLALEGGVDEATLKEQEKTYPMKRYGKPEDIAPLAVYLLSDASGWMTNSCVDITGGAISL